MVAGLTVAIVALPLSMAIAIASGTTPDRGLYTSIFGGFVVSALGGSRFQIGGPAGAFIVLVAATLGQHGFDGLALAILMSGLILLAMGFLGLGTFIKYIPYPVTVGFTAGIAIVIFSGEITDLFGLTLQGPEPGPLISKLTALFDAAPTINVLGGGCRRTLDRHDRFGATLAPALAELFDCGRRREPRGLGPAASRRDDRFAFRRHSTFARCRICRHSRATKSWRCCLRRVAALLGSIESLLSAVVADSMSGGRPFQRRACRSRRGQYRLRYIRRHLRHRHDRPHGDQCTRRRPRSVAGILHSLFLLVFVLVAAPLARYIPLSALAAVLAVVCWNMAEKHQFATLLRASRGDAVVLLATFLVVVFRDLTEGILVGFACGALLFIHRMAHAVEVQRAGPLAEDDMPDLPADEDRLSNAALISRHYRLSHIGRVLLRRGRQCRRSARANRRAPESLCSRLSAVPIIDSTAAATIERLYT